MAMSSTQKIYAGILILAATVAWVISIYFVVYNNDWVPCIFASMCTGLLFITSGLSEKNSFY